MSGAAIFVALARFVIWEAAMFAAGIALAWRLGWRDTHHAAEKWLAVLAIEITLEASLAGLFSFLGANSAIAYWIVAAVCLAASAPFLYRRASLPRPPAPGPRPLFLRAFALIAVLIVPLLFLSFKPVEEIDSINYLHYLIDWMANRATPYTFATNFVAFWELSFLPSWTVTGVDLFFPLLALKAVLLLALAAYLAGRELGVPSRLLLWTVFGSLAMRHFWFEYSGVPTLKNDALHGAGFVLLALVVLRAARGGLASTDMALLAFGAAFAAVKYTGIFAAVLACALVILLGRPPVRSWLSVALVFLLTSGHYYLHNLLRYGSPFYPFQINLLFIHLPGTADLSNTSILYSLHDPRLWRALFLPSGGVSPAGLLFPAILAGVLIAGSWRCLRAAFLWLRRRVPPSALDWTALLLLAGWLLYFRSVFSASGYAGDLAFIRNNLNSIRYVDGVLALSEIFLVALAGARLAWLAWLLVVVNAASRLVDLYAKIPAALFPPLLVAAAALLAGGLFLLLNRRAAMGALAAVVLACPILVERNRLQWTTYWNDLKPALNAVRAEGLAVLAVPDGGYFAAHAVAAGNPVHPAVRTLVPEDLDALPASARPPYLAVMFTSGSEAAADWRVRYGSRLANWGYRPRAEGKYGEILGLRKEREN